MALLSHDRRIFAWWPRANAHRRADALALLDQVGMAAQADRACSELAYGDVKRVELAMALAHICMKIRKFQTLRQLEEESACALA